MKFLNGLKTIIGVVGSVVLVIAPKVGLDVVQSAGDQVYGIAQGVFGLLTILGVIHKVEKSQGGPS